MEKTFFCANEEQTKKLGVILGNLMQAGDIICLQGQLGAGKTTFAKALAQGMGILAEDVTSPTFTIMNVYEGDKKLQHFDFYRIDDSEELEAIGFCEYINSNITSLVEWSDLFPQLLPEKRLEIKIRVAGAGREFMFCPFSKRYEELCQEVEHAYTGD